MKATEPTLKVSEKLHLRRYDNTKPYVSALKDKQLNLEYIKEEARLVLELRSDLEADHGLTKHPKRELLWKKAWEHGHSSGFAEVSLYYGDFAELLS